MYWGVFYQYEYWDGFNQSEYWGVCYQFEYWDGFNQSEYWDVFYTGVCVTSLSTGVWFFYQSECWGGFTSLSTGVCVTGLTSLSTGVLVCVLPV